MSRQRVLLAVGGLLLAGFTLSAFAGFRLPNLLPFRDPSGIFRTLALGPVDLGNPFFKKLGTNDRSCASCHDASEGWSITPPHLQERFQVSEGMDAVFRPVDGANCPSADVSSLKARYINYSLLLYKGLIRMSLPTIRTTARKLPLPGPRSIGVRFPPPTCVFLTGLCGMAASPT